MGRPWQALRALRLRLLGPEKELVGTDQFGNKYYRVPKHETRAVSLGLYLVNMTIFLSGSSS